MTNSTFWNMTNLDQTSSNFGLKNKRSGKQEIPVSSLFHRKSKIKDISAIF